MWLVVQLLPVECWFCLTNQPSLSLTNQLALIVAQSYEGGCRSDIKMASLSSGLQRVSKFAKRKKGMLFSSPFPPSLFVSKPSPPPAPPPPPSPPHHLTPISLPDPHTLTPTPPHTSLTQRVSTCRALAMPRAVAGTALRGWCGNTWHHMGFQPTCMPHPPCPTHLACCPHLWSPCP